MNRKDKVLITRFFPGDAIELLKQNCEVDFCRQIQPLDRDELKLRMKKADAVISMGDGIERDMIMEAENLKVIADMWGGHGIDRKACEEKGIRVCGSGMPITWINHSEAEHAILLMLAVARNLLAEDAFVRSGKYRNYEQANKLFLGQGLYGRKLGIVGGANWSGDQLTKRAVALSMAVRYWDYSRGEAMEALGARFMEFDELLETSDFIVLLSNRHEGYLFDKAQFDRMNQGAILVNVTKGTFINEKELVKALTDGRLAGAGLDKLEYEPVPVQGLTGLKNVVLSPHSDGALLHERNEIFKTLINQCMDILKT
jgi:glyoxylate reductase